MKACVLKKNGIVKCIDVAEPTAKRGEVLVKIGACGICSSDFNRVYRNGAYFYPIILGHEFSGKIIELGEDVDKKYLNKNVVIFPLLPCNECEFCKRKMYAQCKDYNYFGSRCNGAMTEYIAVPLWNIKIIPNNMSYEVAALCEPTAVGIHSVEKIENIKDKNICISGSGTIGIICGLIAKTLNAKVSFIVRNEQKKDFLKALGFTNFVSEKDCTTYDAVIECVGNNSSVLNSIKHVKSGGTIVLVGNPASDINLDKKLYWKILRSEITIKGIWNSSYKNSERDDWDKAIEFLYKNQDICQKLITDRFKLEDSINAFVEKGTEGKTKLKGVFING